MCSYNSFKGRVGVVASQHLKEKAIAPQFKKVFDLDFKAAKYLDTDALGTFSGEIERLLTPINAARKKCQLAMELEDYELAIATEGSFGPHPFYPFLTIHEEIMVMVDRKNEWEFVAKKIDTKTNFNSWSVGSIEQLDDIINLSNFPSHGLIVKKSANNLTDCVKGINSRSILNKVVLKFLETNSTCQVETDMRAMFNPTRMKFISNLTDHLIAQINTICPNCSSPGFHKIDVIRGLPCAICSFKTNGIRADVYACSYCHFQEQRNGVHPSVKEDPMYCDYCNP